MAWFICQKCGHSVAVRNTFRDQILPCMQCGAENVVVDTPPRSHLAALEVGQSLEQEAGQSRGVGETSQPESSPHASSSHGGPPVKTPVPMSGDVPPDSVSTLNLRLPVLASVAITIVYGVLAVSCWNLIEDRKSSRDARERVEREFRFARSTPDELIEETLETVLYLLFYAIIGFSSERFIRAWSGLRWSQHDLWNVEVFAAADVKPNHTRKT